ncbi:MAG: pyridoxamine 5'-phosphate oxidase family protein [Myxococcota bacterium]
MADYEITRRNRVRQLKEEAHYDRTSVHAVLDAGLVAHVGFVEAGQPFVIPMIYGRAGELLYLHGAKKARITRLFGTGAPVCLNVTLLDGIVAARSAFNSSMNYRSVAVFGNARVLDDESECLQALKVISEHSFPGRWDELRAPTDTEIKQTGVVALPIDSASAKIADGPPDDEDADYEIPVWAGVVPIRTELGSPQGDDRLIDGVALSPSIAALEGTRR